MLSENVLVPKNATSYWAFGNQDSIYLQNVCAEEEIPERDWYDSKESIWCQKVWDIEEFEQEEDFRTVAEGCAVAWIRNLIIYWEKTNQKC